MVVKKKGGGIRKTSSVVKKKATGTSALHNSANKQYGTNYATSASSASKASKVLKSKASSNNKSIAGSVLSQRNTKNKK